jgi:hypothetical protein
MQQSQPARQSRSVEQVLSVEQHRSVDQRRPMGQSRPVRQHSATVRHVALNAPLLLLAYGLLHLIDGLDGSYGPGLAQNLSYLAFLAAMVLFGLLAAAVRPLVAPSARTVAAVAATVTLAGTACFLWAIAGDLTGAFPDATPVRIAGLLFLALGMLTLLGLLVAARQTPAWSPLLFGAGIAAIIIDVGYLPLGALIVLAALAPLARPALIVPMARRQTNRTETNRAGTNPAATNRAGMNRAGMNRAGMNRAGTSGTEVSGVAASGTKANRLERAASQ